jgi:protein-tyrosine-phosphatase
MRFSAEISVEEEVLMTTPYRVLILCTGNSARSILAEALLNRLGSGRFIACSAGSQPKGKVHPLALELLSQRGYSIDELRSKSWNEFAAPTAPQLDFIFTVCGNAAAESCPIWPGHPATAHWGVDDPAAASGTLDEQRAAFAKAYEELEARIKRFVALPIDSLRKDVLRTELQKIGQM